MGFSINHEIFNHINSSPKYFSDGDLTFLYKSCDDNYLGFILPRRLGAAHDRNLFKRRCRAIFQSMNKNKLLSNMGIIIKTKRINVPYKNISGAFSGLSNNVSSK